MSPGDSRLGLVTWLHPPSHTHTRKVPVIIHLLIVVFPEEETWGRGECHSSRPSQETRKLLPSNPAPQNSCLLPGSHDPESCSPQLPECKVLPRGAPLFFPGGGGPQTDSEHERLLPEPHTPFSCKKKLLGVVTAFQVPLQRGLMVTRSRVSREFSGRSGNPATQRRSCCHSATWGSRARLCS